MKKPKERAKMAELLVLLLLSYLLSIGARPYAVPDDNEILGCACVRYVPGSIELLYLSYEHWNWVGECVIVGIFEGCNVGSGVGWLVGNVDGWPTALNEFLDKAAYVIKVSMSSK